MTLDNDGVAHRVPEGQGTHYIHVSDSNETVLEVKVKKWVRLINVLTLIFDALKPKMALDKAVPSDTTLQRPITEQPPSKQRIHPFDDNEKK